MAEFLEFDSPEDADRLIDSCSFQSSQFDIFTHDYREYSDQIEKNAEASSGCGCGKKESDCSNSHKVDKKELVNLTRQLGKMHKSIIRIKRENSFLKISDELVEEIMDVQRQLAAFVRSEKTEFSAGTVDLPDFDVNDIELLLGEAPSQQSMMNMLLKAKSSDSDKLNELMFKAHMFLTECEHIINTVDDECR